MTETRVKFPSGNLTLEGIVTMPEGNGQFPGVVICHPHPLYGGAMDNNVIVPVCRALAKASIISLRFNFRGVGASEGRFANGVGEKQDIIAALNYLSSLEAVDKARIGLSGYSFGGALSLEIAPNDKRVKALALISPAVESYAPLQHYTMPKLVICGGADQFVSIIALQRLAEELPPPNEYEFVAGADHFWSGYEEKVANRVVAFFTKAFNPPPKEG